MKNKIKESLTKSLSKVLKENFSYDDYEQGYQPAEPDNPDYMRGWEDGMEAGKIGGMFGEGCGNPHKRDELYENEKAINPAVKNMYGRQQDKLISMYKKTRSESKKRRILRQLDQLRIDGYEWFAKQYDLPLYADKWTGSGQGSYEGDENLEEDHPFDGQPGEWSKAGEWAGMAESKKK